jgi:hypothetical protein
MSVIFHKAKVLEDVRFTATDAAFMIVLTREAGREAVSFPYKSSSGRIHDFVKTRPPSKSGR